MGRKPYKTNVAEHKGGKPIMGEVEEGLRRDLGGPVGTTGQRVVLRHVVMTGEARILHRIIHDSGETPRSAISRARVEQSRRAGAAARAEPPGPIRTPRS